MPKHHPQEDDFDLEYAEPANATGHRQRSLRDYFHWIMRRLWLVILMAVAGTVLGMYVYKNTPKTFSSRATIQIDRQGSVVRMDGNDQELRLSGDSLINTVAQKFALPKFYLVLAEDYDLVENPNILPKKFRWLPQKEEPDPVNSWLTPERLADIMPNWVRTRTSKGSNLMDIIVTHTDPEICQLVANGIIESYEKVTQMELRQESGDTVGRVVEEMSDIRGEVGNLSMRKSGYAELLKTKDMIDETDLKLAQMNTRYGPKWDPFNDVKKLRAQLQQKFVRELEIVKSGDEEEALYWEAAEARGDDPVDRLQPRVTLLEGQLNTAETNLLMMNETQQQAQLDAGDGDEFSVQRPAQAGSPTGPDPVKVMSKFVLGGTGLGIGIVMLLGFLDPSVRTIPEIEGLFDLPILGAVPFDKTQSTRKQGKRRAAPEIHMDHSPSTEAIRNLRAGLSFLGNRGERRSFVLTSSIPGEGKSWVSANLAAAFGAQGDKTLIIDLDLRKPTQHRIFKMDRTPGVTDLMTQGTPLKAVLRKTKFENVTIMTAGTKSPSPSELLTPKNLRKLIDMIPADIDRIIIDTAPLLAVRDALAPSTMVDSTLVVFKMASTPVKALDRLLKVMSENNTYPVGIIANSLPSSTTKGYGEYYYGYHGYGDYYEDEEDD